MRLPEYKDRVIASKESPKQATSEQDANSIELFSIDLRDRKGAVRKAIKALLVVAGISLLGPDFVVNNNPLYVVYKSLVKRPLDAAGLYYELSLESALQDRTENTLKGCEEFLSLNNAGVEGQMEDAINAASQIARGGTSGAAFNLADSVFNTIWARPVTTCHCEAGQTERGGTYYGCFLTKFPVKKISPAEREMNQNEIVAWDHYDYSFKVTLDRDGQPIWLNLSNGQDSVIGRGPSRGFDQDVESQARTRFLRLLAATGCHERDQCDEVDISQNGAVHMSQTPEYKSHAYFRANPIAGEEAYSQKPQNHGSVRWWATDPQREVGYPMGSWDEE